VAPDRAASQATTRLQYDSTTGTYTSDHLVNSWCHVKVIENRWRVDLTDNMAVYGHEPLPVRRVPSDDRGTRGRPSRAREGRLAGVPG
jgi:hypothetical protein